MALCVRVELVQFVCIPGHTPLFACAQHHGLRALYQCYWFQVLHTLRLLHRYVLRIPIPQYSLAAVYVAPVRIKYTFSYFSFSYLSISAATTLSKNELISFSCTRRSSVDSDAELITSSSLSVPDRCF